MKLRELPHLLGWKPAPRTYGFEVRRFTLPRDGVVEYAQWLHPAETPKVIRQEVVDELRTFIRPGDVGDRCLVVGELAEHPEVPAARRFPAMSRTQVLQQAATAMVAQANQLPQQVLTLLKG